MEFYPIEMRTNYAKSTYAVVENQQPVFSWGAVNSLKNSYQTSFKITLLSGGKLLWDSGEIKSDKQSCKYGGCTLESGNLYEWTLELTDNFGNVSKKGTGSFKTACFEDWQGQWIESTIEEKYEAQYFVSQFELDTMPERAVLYHCGIGLSKAYLNGTPTNFNRLEPAYTNYAKECQYVTDIIDTEILNIGKNTIGIAVGGGWRKNYGEYLDNLSENRKIEFLGDISLNAQLVLYFADGTKKVIATDDSWKCMHGAITHTHLFDGETYDEFEEKNEWNINYLNYENKPVKISDFNTLKLVPQVVEPVVEKRIIKPVADYYLGDKHIFDFGENLAGVIKLSVDGTCNGKVVFKLKHAELLKEDGDLFTEPLRGAKAEDKFILKSGEHNCFYAPEFTYHGFRYACLETEGNFDGKVSLEAISFYTDIDAENHFKCSNTLVNEFYNCVLRTERANLHSVATDCPQRDERMGWMNDATVRFMAMKYNFMPARLYEKFVGDVTNEQDHLGRITCTAPFVYGERPADPVCSAYLIAAREHYNITGSTELINKHYDNFAAWNEYLKSRRKDGIVDYSYYGDWAGPEDCCYNVDTIGNSDTKKLEEYDTGAANSVFVPGELISTAFHYMNYKMLSEFATLTGRSADVEKFEKEAQIVKEAFCKKWIKYGAVHNSSQPCQALALFAGLVPDNEIEKAAEIMNNAVADSGYRLQTANLTTPMLLKMLMKYGYGNTAWKLLTRYEYPSWGYEIANGATTIWERFELKKNSGMNSHNHPMYGASVDSLYEGIAGLKINSPAEEYTIAPFIPEDVAYYEMKIPTLRGSIYLKAEYKYGKKTVYISVPFGIKVNLITKGKKEQLGSGFYTAEL